MANSAVETRPAPQTTLPSTNADAPRGKWSKFRALEEGTVGLYLESHPQLSSRLGGSSASWRISEVGDGNINYVYIVKGPLGALVLKQALPYIRCVGESWPMTLERINFEAKALQAEFRLDPEHVPEVYLHDATMALIVMEYLAPPHIILRKGLVKALPYPHLADHVSTFLARTLFGTSLIATSTASFRPKVAEYCNNVEMCRLTEQVIFTEPYFLSPNNRWTTPQLDAEARGIREDTELKVHVAALKKKFCENAQALLHGDLHTCSIMATESSTKVIDPEFAFYGPMGFDIGAFLANLLLAYFSQDGHATEEQPREEYKKWILGTFQETWRLFESKFLGLWSASAEAAAAKAAAETGTTTTSSSSSSSSESLGTGTGTGPGGSGGGSVHGDAYALSVFESGEVLRVAQGAYMEELLADSLGFAGAKMIRRIVGIAHVEDLESISDPDRRAECERRALGLAKVLVKKRQEIKSIEEAAKLVEAEC